MILVDRDREETEACLRDPAVAALAGLVAAGAFDDDAVLEAAVAGAGTVESAFVGTEVDAFLLFEAFGRGFA